MRVLGRERAGIAAGWRKAESVGKREKRDREREREKREILHVTELLK